MCSVNLSESLRVILDNECDYSDDQDNAWLYDSDADKYDDYINLTEFKMSNYSDLPAETINAVIEAYGKVTDELIGISNPTSCHDANQVIDDIKKTQSEENSLTHSDDLSQILEDEHPEAGKLVRDYFKSMVSDDEDVEDYESR
ncbi:hypothetical protein [Psychrobacter sp. K31L]|uniref:hypothetical protein n=1 Tax=Psychrobacter sp. K31L TaxID=2820758 RepID=UPI001B3387BA|nr:hypothetical protein [Psychrobacter sp. K31L]MBP3945132.1 hypothetical protein [Psychrobacter sp. K31L]